MVLNPYQESAVCRVIRDLTSGHLMIVKTPSGDSPDRVIIGAPSNLIEILVDRGWIQPPQTGSIWTLTEKGKAQGRIYLDHAT